MPLHAVKIIFGVPIVTVLEEDAQEEDDPQEPPRARRRTANGRAAKPRKIKKAAFSVWINSCDRLTIRDQVFRPLERVPNDEINLWPGFAWNEVDLESSRAFSTPDYDLRAFLEYVWNVIASQSMKTFDYIVDWFAFIMAHPDRQTLTAPILVGPEGVGKTLIGQVFGQYLGKAYCNVVGPTTVLERFNQILMGKTMIHLDEIDHLSIEETSRLKGMVTGLEKTIEYKGIDVFKVEIPSNIFITSNNVTRQILYVGPNARRWAFMKCTDYPRILTKEYFISAYDWLEIEIPSKRGCKCFLSWLQRTRVPRVREARTTQNPRTAMLVAQKLATMPIEHLYFHECIRLGCVRRNYSVLEMSDPNNYRIAWSPNDGLEIDMNLFHDLFVLWCEHKKCKPSPIMAFNQLIKDVLGDQMVIAANALRATSVLRFPPLEICKKRFEEFYHFSTSDLVDSESLNWSHLPAQIAL
ncbi:MAG: hypothetical protein EHM41_00825 [Chloroflexi bacterium]|nr:MAG: hypothetical protein EHM41_00825 [Chloroflexota bacterium]